MRKQITETSWVTRFTPSTLKGLRPAPTGVRIELYEKLTPGFGIRITDNPKGVYSYFTKHRFGGSPNQSRRTIGRVGGAISLAEARAKAKEWAGAAAQKRDPAAEARKAAAEKAARITFDQALEDYIIRRVRKQRRAKQTERELRTYLGKKWEGRPLEEISKADVIKLVEAIAAGGAERQAINILGLAKTFLRWCVDSDRLTFSPCESLRAKKLVGEKRHRQRVLSDLEIAAVWRATEKLNDPWRSFYQLCFLTGARRTEVSDARWKEFELAGDKPVWTIPPERFKSDKVHLIPLSSDAVDVLERLRGDQGEHGDFVFSTTGGKIPIDGFSKSKADLNALVAVELGAEPERWVTHDIRRSVRTQLSKLRVPTEVSELVIGHALPMLHQVYDQHHFLDERREALELWARRLRSIVNPPAAPNVTDLEQERRARA